MSTSLLPPIQTWDEYRSLLADPPRIWTAIEAVAARHSVPQLEQRASGGSQLVGLAGSHVIKIFAPMSLGDYAAERIGLNAARGALPVDIPEILAEGELDGWPYFVLSRLRGPELSDAWPTLPSDHRMRLIAQTGELAAALHELPIPEDAALPDAQSWLLRPTAEYIDKQRADRVTAPWLDAIEEALDRVRPGDWSASSVLLHCDLHPEHLMWQLNDGLPELTGLFDFGDTMVGPPEFELAATGILMACHEPGGLRTLLTAYGWSADQLDARLEARLVIALFGQRYCALPQILPAIPEQRRPTTVPELVACITDIRP